MTRDKVDDREAALYGLPLEDFTQARNALAAELKKAGQSDEATRVKALAKPPASVWAINQLARQRGDDVRALLERGAALVAGQRRALKGQDASAFLDEARAERQEVSRLVAAAEKILGEAGKKPTPALGRRIGQTLHAAAIGDAEARAAVAEGRLTTDLEPPSVLALGPALASVPPPPAPRPQASKPSKPTKADRAREARERAKAEAARKRAAAEEKRAQAKREAARKQAKRALDKIEAEHARAEKEARAAAERAEFLKRKLDAARERLDGLE